MARPQLPAAPQNMCRACVQECQQGLSGLPHYGACQLRSYTPQSPTQRCPRLNDIRRATKRQPPSQQDMFVKPTGSCSTKNFAHGRGKSQSKIQQTQHALNFLRWRALPSIFHRLRASLLWGLASLLSRGDDSLTMQNILSSGH